MPCIAKVVVDLSLDREFDYLVPPALQKQLRPGSRVVVPFGRTEKTGYVVALSDTSSHGSLKPITSLVGDRPLISDTLLRLAEWMASYYCAPRERAIRTVLPGAVRGRRSGFKTQRFVFLAPEPAGEAASAEPGVVAPPARDDPVSCARGGATRALTPKQQAVLDRLSEAGRLLMTDLIRELGITEGPVRALEKKGLVKIESDALRRDPGAARTILRTAPLDLMPEQATALDVINQLSDAQASGPGRSHGDKPGSPGVVLLYGVTGSGKTEVYLQAIDHVLAHGMGAIVLVPEIALTPQTVERFVGRFGDRIAVLHSHLSDGERHDEWFRVLEGKADIVVGARSAVFAPVHHLGLIVIDEEHEPSYKQEEAPRYSARDVAVMRGAMEGCPVVLGSATPSIESWSNVKKGKYLLSTLTCRADNRKMPVMRILDMRVETQREGHAVAFSRDLMEAIRLRLARSEQTILFLNRRGFSTSLICPQCGYVANCDLCSVSYTYHAKGGELRCHICGARKRVPATCPSCRDPAFRYAGIGTQRVEAIAAKCFPQANIQRMDADVTTTKDAYDRILGDFRVGKIDILIGTQMIAKGLHFPNVTLVGVVYADLSLHMPDFRASERTFQLLAQVAGRAGRGEVAGEVLVQTYTPFNPAVQAARRLDYEGLCDQEMAMREELRYPPFSHLICITLRGASEEQVAFSAEALAKALAPKLPKHVILSDAAPAPLARAKGLYRYQVMMRGPATSSMTRPLMVALRAFRFGPKVSCTVDVDALSLL